jgi:peptidoglycan/LPS O-acetylase OafA/YrhL
VWRDPVRVKTLLRLHVTRVDPSLGSRLVGIEGMRALAAGSIVVFHTWLYSDPRGYAPDFGRVGSWILPNLALGVTLFFTLSGFLLYRPFAAAIMRGEHLPSVRRYLRNRALRILPAYWVILLFVALALEAALVAPGSDRIGALDDPSVLARDALLVQGYDRGTLLTGIGPAWSLAVEAVFYLALPLLVLLAWVLGKQAASRAGRRLAALVPALVVFAVGVSGKVLGAVGVTDGSGWDGTWHSVLERSFWGQADLFTFGILVAVLRVDAEDGLLRLPRWWRAGVWAAVLLVALGTLKLTRTGHLHPYAYETLMALACGLLLVLVVVPGSRPGAPGLLRFLESRPLVATGVISYSIFLWHEPVVRWLQSQGLTLSGAGGFFLNLAVLGTVVWLLSALTYRYVELPALRRKGRRAREPESARAVPRHQAQAAP